MKLNHRHLLNNYTNSINEPKAVLPNKTIIKATKFGHINLHKNLSKNAKEAFVFPNLTNESLVSVGKLCDDECEVNFTKDDVKVSKNNEIIIKGKRNSLNGLWNINIPLPRNIISQNNISKNRTIQNNTINYMVQKDKTKLELAQYLHATAFLLQFLQSKQL